MRISLRTIPLAAMLVTFLSAASGVEYTCEPGTDPTVCNIRALLYDDKAAAKNASTLPKVTYPKSVRTVRLLYDRYYYNRRTAMNRYDTIIHTTVLHDPPILRITDSRLRQLVMPNNLEVGEFSNNVLNTIETDANQTYAVHYLDLSQNSLLSVANLSALVRLQNLNLEDNHIRTLDADIFARMDNLTHLYLSDNNIETIDLRQMPKSLTVLWLVRNELRELPLAGVSLPALTEVDVEINLLNTLDLAALFTAFPALRMMPIAYNVFPKEEAVRIIADLRRHNVTYYVGLELEDGAMCDPEEYRVENLCFVATMLGAKSFWKALYLFVIGAAVLGVFVVTVRWIWYQMRY